MKRKLFYVTLAVLLTLLLSVGGVTGQGPGPEGDIQPQGARPERVEGEVSIAATVNSRISYQGVLKESGSPVTGSRDMTFRLYSDAACTTQVGSDIAKPGVTVADGLFSVELDVTHSNFNGQGLWLEVEVGGTAIGCREIMPVPYALSLRPGAQVIGQQTGWNAIYASNTATTGYSYGLRADSSSTSGRGVSGWATATSGTTYGVYGQSNSTSGRGVRGYASAASGETYGVYGSTASNTTGASGVYGTAGDAAIVTGVTGRATATSGSNFGVRGLTDSTSGTGVYGWAGASSGTNYGVTGVSNSLSGYAGKFYGRVDITGNLSKGGGGFKIDHPLDPTNQYLYHSFVESPDMKNVYDGVVVLDADGTAWVELPAWFEALNRDFRYQLTCIGGFAPVYIAQEIEDNRFQIAGGSPGLKVSWQVTGIRQDPWANANRIPVEEEKPADEQGYYRHPELYGQPQSMSIRSAHGFRGE